MFGSDGLLSVCAAGVASTKKKTVAATTLGVVGIVCASCAVVFLIGFMTEDDYPGDWLGFLVNYWLTFHHDSTRKIIRGLL